MADLEGGLLELRPATLLEFLAATAKTGTLRVAGAQRTVTVWVRDGAAVAADSTGGDHDLVDQLVDLLRTPNGTFRFIEDNLAEPAMPHPAPQDAREPDANLLTSAVERLHEWEALADAVPSLSLVVKLLNADSEDVTLSSAAWSLSVAVSSGHPSIEGAARHLKWSSYKTCKAVRELVDAGRATLVAPPRRRRRGSRIEAPAQSPGSWHAANRPLWPGTGGNDRDRFSQAWASEE